MPKLVDMRVVGKVDAIRKRGAEIEISRTELPHEPFQKGKRPRAAARQPDKQDRHASRRAILMNRA